MDAENLLTAEQVLDTCDENTIAVIVTFGQTSLGSSRDVAGALPLDDLQNRTGLDIPIHVDAASGEASVAPFCAPDIVWDFRIARVKS
jgi:glutamate decarboxylase